MRAVIYTRVSTDMQERDGTSLGTQESRCLEYAQERGYAVLERLSDAASGFTLDRPGMARLRALVTSGEVDVVVTYAVDRLSRNQNHMGVLFDEMQRHDVRLEVVSEPFEDTAIGRFILAARAFMAEVEREKIAERTSRGRRQAAADGSYVGSLPYGYVRDGKGLAIHEEQAAVVRRIYELYGRNMGVSAIAGVLNREGIPTMTGAPWHGPTVRGILTRETYTGTLIYTDVRVEDAVPAIIDRETWQAVQERMRAKARIGGGQTQRSTFLLTGVIYCGACGGRMSGTTTRTRYGVYPAYICNTHKHQGLCQRNYHPAPEVEAQVIADLTSLGMRVRDRTAETRRAALERDLAASEEAIARNTRRRDTIIARIADDTLSGEMARDAVERIESERAGLLADQRRLVTDLADLDAALARQGEWAEHQRQLLDPTLPIAERKQIIQHAVRRIELYPGDPVPIIVS